MRKPWFYPTPCAKIRGENLGFVLCDGFYSLNRLATRSASPHRALRFSSVCPCHVSHFSPLCPPSPALLFITHRRRGFTIHSSAFGAFGFCFGRRSASLSRNQRSLVWLTALLRSWLDKPCRNCYNTLSLCLRGNNNGNNEKR